MWRNNDALAQVSFVVYFMQHTYPSISVQFTTEANKKLKELNDLRSIISFRSTSFSVFDVWICNFYDAFFNISSARYYLKTGIIIGHHPCEISDYKFNAIDWTISKRKWFSHSSYGVEILPCADGDDKWFYIRQAAGKWLHVHTCPT